MPVGRVSTGPAAKLPSAWASRVFTADGSEMVVPVAVHTISSLLSPFRSATRILSGSASVGMRTGLRKLSPDEEDAARKTKKDTKASLYFTQDLLCGRNGIWKEVNVAAELPLRKRCKTESGPIA